MFFNYISLPVFILSFSVGLFFIYILGPEIKSIYIYPTPETIGKVMVKDKADNCFYYEEQIVNCPSDETQISSTPIQS